MNQISFRDEEEAGEWRDDGVYGVRLFFSLPFPPALCGKPISRNMLGLFWLELINLFYLIHMHDA